VDLAVQLIQAEWGHGAFLDLYAPSASSDPGFARWWARYERLAASPAMATAIIQLAAETDIREVLPAISVPTLVLHRRDDQLLPVEGARFVAERIGGANLIELDGVDHFPYVGDTDAMMDEIESFLTGTRHAPDLNRQLLTVLFTDIVGSTERAADLGDRRWRALLEGHNEAVREQLRRFRGEEVKTIGDGFLATFDGPARGVRCAQAIALTARQLGIDVRTGLHTGECEIQESDITGMAVNIGARICALADPGEVLVSSTVRDLVVGSAIAFEPRGSHPMKGVPGEWTLYAAAGM
jgi:class 3 adenylate cyclase